VKIRDIPFLFPFFLQLMRYKKCSPREKIPLKDLHPCLRENNSESQSGKGHYFYQDIWALQKVALHKPRKHVDIGSRIDGFAGQCSALCTVEFLDIRPVDLGLPNFSMTRGDILSLPYGDDSIVSLSSLHVIEHVGLGRYGDPLDPQGSQKAAAELCRVLTPGGNLYVGVPLGRERVCFNAHRIFSPDTIAAFFSSLDLVSLSGVNDEGFFLEKASFADFYSAEYACGLFHFTKKTEVVPSEKREEL